MADRHAVFKQCLKEVADSLGMSVTFMAKPDSAQAGSSCHVHMSLWQDGENAMAGEGRLGPVLCSDTFRWFLGGWIAHAPEFMVFYAPTVNSYKRFRAGSWAPTRLAWSHDNRTASFRVVGKGPSLRIECRIPGADCNPYLCFAAALASGLDGIANQIEPPPLFDGDVYAAKSLPPCLPHFGRPRPFPIQPVRRAKRWAPGWPSITRISSNSSRRPTNGGHRLGAQALLRAI